MAVIVLASPKGGAGKSTAATILATELAQRDVGVTLIDADPNQNVVDWSRLAAMPPKLKVVGEADEHTITDLIEQAAAESAFVIIDLEGTASLMSSYAIGMADLVLIPMQGSQMDAKQGARQVHMILSQQKVVRRKIPYAIVFTRTSPAIQPKTLRHIEASFSERDVPALQTKLADREAFRAIFSFGGTVEGLAAKGVSNLDAAIQNARAFTAEVIEYLRAAKRRLGEAA